MEGVTLSQITLRGIYVQSKEGRSFLPLVSKQKAYEMTYAKNEEPEEPSDDQIQDFLNSQMATPASGTGQIVR
jgi:hypothetical protein